MIDAFGTYGTWFPPRRRLVILLAGLLSVLGWIALVPVEGEEPLPKKVSLVGEFDRLGLTPLQQGNQDSCGVFAITSLLEFESENKAPAPHKPLSEEYIIWAACEVSGKTHEQSMFFELAEAINKEGVCTAEAMPYTKTFDLKHKPSGEAIAQSRSYRERWRVNWIRRWAYEPPLTDEQMGQIKHALSDEHPVAIGVRWPNTNDNAKLESQLLTPPPARELFDGHAIALVGFEDDTRKPGGGTFIFCNSFGPNWADQGYGKMSYAYARNYANDILWLQYGSPHSEVPTYHFEAEAMRQLATHHCTASEQDMSPWEGQLWSGGKQLYCLAEKGGSVELALHVPKAGRYRACVLATAAPDYGVVRVELDGKRAGTPFDLYAGRVCPSGSLELGTFDLFAGQHRLLLTAAGKNAVSKDYSFGIDAIDLFTAADTK
jgi:hypothetical protein